MIWVAAADADADAGATDDDDDYSDEEGDRGSPAMKVSISLL